MSSAFFRRFFYISWFIPLDVLLGKLGLTAAQVHPSASLFWPVIGLDAAIMIAFGWQVAPVIFVAAFLYNILTFGTLLTCLIIASGNTLKIIVVAKLFGKRHICKEYRRFTLCAIPAAFVGATIGLLALLLNNNIYSILDLNNTILQFWSIGDYGGQLILITWLNWLLGDYLGLIFFTPFFLMLMRKLKIHEYD